MKGKKLFTSSMIATGLLLIVAAALLVLDYLAEENRAGQASRETAAQINAALVNVPPISDKDGPVFDDVQNGLPDYILNPDKAMPTVTIDEYEYIGILSIPSLGLELPVMSDWSYPRLRISPCRYAGSAYLPGFSIAAHSYDAHFGRLSTCEVGVQLLFTDCDGNRFSYSLGEILTVAPAEVETVMDEDWDLTLFTCVPSGKSRVVLHCRKDG